VVRPEPSAAWARRRSTLLCRCRTDGRLRERDLNAWDIAGGALLVSEAGGRVTGLHGESFTSRGRSVLASNNLIHDAMLQTVRSVE
jgi:fructose-1,6-bisphosphatase/inositol monophosphatase family enzyme